MDADELRAACFNLRREITQIGYWRRLVRARLDLTVARAVLPARLGENVVPLGAARPAVAHGVLVGIAQAGPGLSVADLPRLRCAEEALADYEMEVRRALMIATDALVDQMSADPEFRALHAPLVPAIHDEATNGVAQCTVSQRT